MRRALGLSCLLLLCLCGASSAETLARVKATLAPVTIASDSSSEQVTQVFFWDPIRVLKIQGEWAKVVVPEQYRTEQGYPGWMKLSALEMKPVSPGSSWVAAGYPLIALRAEPDTGARIITKVFMSTRLPLLAERRRDTGGEEWLGVQLPGGGSAWVRASQVQQETEPRLASGLGTVVEKARKLESTPYLWGGMSQAGIDCSGLVYVSYRLNGVTLPRDADQQFQVGQAVAPEELAAGDLVFFGTPGDITHVGIYVENGTFVHASSGVGVICSPLFEGWYKRHYQGARRILEDGGNGTRVLIPEEGRLSP